MIVNAITLEEDDYSRALNAIQARVEERCGHPCHVFYSAYTKTDDIPIDNLDLVPHVGLIQFQAPAASKGFTDGEESQAYVSGVIESPTWLDLCVMANDMMKMTKDFHHVYLEDICDLDERGDVTIATFSMGS